MTRESWQIPQSLSLCSESCGVCGLHCHPCLQLPTEATCWITHPSLSPSLPQLFLLFYAGSQHHLPNKWLVFELLSWDLLVGESRLSPLCPGVSLPHRSARQTTISLVPVITQCLSDGRIIMLQKTASGQVDQWQPDKMGREGATKEDLKVLKRPKT